MKRSLWLLLLSAGTISLTGCSLNPQSSRTDEDPAVTITAETTGAVAFASIDETSIADDLLTIENPAPANQFEQPALPPVSGATKKSLAKRTAGGSLSIDTIDGTIRITNVTPGPLATRHDTIEVVMDETVFDAIDGNESVTALRGSTVNIAGTIEYYSVQDRDGDKVINGTTGTQRASMALRTVYTKDLVGMRSGEATVVCFDADAGTDNNFDTDADNRLYSASWVRLDGDDTLAYAFYDDADGNGVIAASGAGTIDVRYYESGNPLKPLVDYSKATVRLERDAAGNDRTARFSAEEKLVTGRCNRVWVVDSTGDPTISTGETAFVHFATNSPAVADSEITAQAIFTINPGNDLGNVADNTCSAIYLAKSYRFGKLDSMEFTCTFDRPVPHGAKPETGTFSLKTVYRNGQTATLVGTFGSGTIEATFTGPQGNVKDVTLRDSDTTQ